MFTINYKGYYINGYCDKSQCRIVSPDSIIIGAYKNMRQAKRIISILIKDQQKMNEGK